MACKNITILCDRCGKVVNGICDEISEGGMLTGGYYSLLSEAWKKYARWEEENICDNCMQSDPLYLKDRNK